ncbi:hypothetical protein SLA2020_492190 [Shorea laevis]
MVVSQSTCSRTQRDHAVMNCFCSHQKSSSWFCSSSFLQIQPRRIAFHIVVKPRRMKFHRAEKRGFAARKVLTLFSLYCECIIEEESLHPRCQHKSSGAVVILHILEI